MKMRHRSMLLVLALAGCAQTATRPGGVALATGDRYVAMGSSFAAGPGVTTTIADSRRCTRSVDNYAHQLARKRGLQLTDVSCGGAMTVHLLGPWSELPPQLDALTPDTALVTVTIGGNDVMYIGGLIGTSCPQGPTPARPCRLQSPPPEASWQALESAMDRFAVEVRRRSPRARLDFVQYPVVLPPRGLCADVPISAEQAKTSRAIAARLAVVTRKVALRAGADTLPMDVLSRGHDACAAKPWMNGFQRPGGPKVAVPYHPNLAGMTAVAAALDRMLSR